jgi:hypothetical protein
MRQTRLTSDETPSKLTHSPIVTRSTIAVQRDHNGFTITSHENFPDRIRKRCKQQRACNS